jgi:glutamate-1-semialdehyde aminotransferase
MIFGEEDAREWIRDTATSGRLFQAMLEAGGHVASSQFEAGFIRIAHTVDVIDAPIEAARRAFRAI